MKRFKNKILSGLLAFATCLFGVGVICAGVNFVSKNAKNSCLNVTTLFATFTPNMKKMILSNKVTINYNNNKNNEDISLNYIAKLKYLLSVMKSPNDARGISRIFIK